MDGSQLRRVVLACLGCCVRCVHDLTSCMVDRKDGRKPASRVVKSILQMLQLSQAPLHFKLKGETLEQQTLKYSSELLKAIESGTRSCGQLALSFISTTFLHDRSYHLPTRLQRKILCAWDNCTDMLQKHTNPQGHALGGP
uniref:Uncharacterized protein n=1 Tax=Oryza brachyantha TaxID=4533 RepID=J3LCR1_ORYBR